MIEQEVFLCTITFYDEVGDIIAIHHIEANGCKPSIEDLINYIGMLRDCYPEIGMAETEFG